MCASTWLRLAAAAGSAVLGLFGGALAQTPSARAINGGSSYTNSLDYQRWWWTFQPRAYPLGYIPPDARLRALEEIEQSKAERGPPLVTSTGDSWVNIGPAPILGGQIGTQQGTRPMSGRIDAVAADPASANHWLIGAADGGVWETRDAGTNWTPLTDAQPSLAMGALAFATSNVIYAGTGAACFSGDAAGGAGLLKSGDGGLSWQLLAASTFGNISFSRLRVNPTNSGVLLSANTRGFFGRDGEYPPTLPARGIFKSTNGGTNWSLKIAGEGTALEVDTNNFQRQYAGLGDIFGDATNGVYRSTNSGDSWTRITGPWATNSSGVGRVELALAPSNPNFLYVSIQDSLNGVGHDGALLGLWLTTNAWDGAPAWTKISVSATDDGSGVLGYCGWAPGYNIAVNACWSTHILIVDPLSPNILYAGGVPLWKFDGTNWVEVSKTAADPAHGIKVDQHALGWVGNRLLVGNDGGLWSTTDGGNTWNDHNTNLSTLQFYEGALHPTRPNFALAGSQDHGTTRWGGSNAWPLIFGGDGGSPAISSNKPDQNWAFTTQQLQIFRTTNGGVGISETDAGIDTTGVPFIARLKESPNNDDIFIAGTDNLWKCTNFFNATSPTWFANGPEMGAGLSALAFAPADAASRTYAFGCATGQLRLTTNSGALWTDLDAANTVPNRYVTDLGFNPTNASFLYVTLSGFDQGTPSQPGHVFRTTNALAASPTWSNITPPSNLPYNCLALDPANPATLYVGTDIGLWRSTNSGGSWTHMGPANGMPNVPVYDIKIIPATGRAVAFTHGRSAFALVDSTNVGKLRITSFALGSTNTTVAFTTDLNQLYRVERAAQLPANVWSNAADHIQGTGGVVQTNILRPSGPQWFYRVRRL